MAHEKDDSSSLGFLILGVNDLLKKAKHAIESKNIDRLHDIGIIVERYFCKKIANHDLDALCYLNDYLVDFLAWFEWGGNPRWSEAEAIATRWKTILELTQQILQTESPLKAYNVMKSAKQYGKLLISLIYNRKVMTHDEILNALGISNFPEDFNLFTEFENAGIIITETDGEKTWISLGKQGVAVYHKDIAPFEISPEVGMDVITALKEIEKKRFTVAHEKLKELAIKSPGNPFVLCLQGLLAIKKGDLDNAGRYWIDMFYLEPDRIRVFMFFYLLDKIGELDEFKRGIKTINLQKDYISRQVQPTMRLLGLLAEYEGKPDRARDYHQLSYSENR